MARTSTYDYVIVGAGSAGCVLANRLSAERKARVLVLEAGPPDRDLMIHIPAAVYKVYKDPAINWNYASQPERSLDRRSIDTPRGKVVGGSSSINSMVYMRGHPLDYDRWADDFGLDGWRYADCLAYFRAGETYARGGDTWRGDAGPLKVSPGYLENPLFDAFLAAGEAAGKGRSDDLNGYRPEGVARFDATRWKGRRCSAAVAHLSPALGRANLTMVTRALARRIVIDKGRAVAVEYDVGGRLHRAEAGREIILAGGAINSPQLLMLSGIGPGDELARHGIAPVHHLPGVGENLQDHVTVIMTWRCLKPVTIDYLARPARKLAAGARWLIDRRGPAASNIWEAGGLVRGNDTVAYPNLQYHFAPVGVEQDGGKLRLNQAFSLHVDQLRPASRGRVRLASKDPTAKPEITFNYLAEAGDMAQLVEGVRLARELVAQKPFDEFRGEEIHLGAEAQSDADIAAAIRAIAETDFHPCGTCRMGDDEMAVVDGEMRVRGIAGLRVVDASVMPRIISANLNGPVQMLAARAADFITGTAQLPPIHAPFHFQEE